MNPVLYPELSPDEIDQFIGTIDRSVFALDEDHLFSVPPSMRQLTDFGPSVEDFSFECVTRHVVGAFMKRWFSVDNTLLADADGFRRATENTLTKDILPMMIRPLAEALRPRPELDDAQAYQAFCQELLSDGFGSFAAGYPVMWRRLHTRLTHRLEALAETFDRIGSDWDAIALAFDLDPAARITALDLSGDTHGGGRNVSVVHTTTGQRFIYKPRTVDSEAAYESLCDWLNEKVTGRFTCPRILRREGYGYAEFVVSDAEAAVDLYRTGQLAAVLYALNARDMHFTNILSSPDGPVPIDLETLLHPQRHNANGVMESGDSGYQMLERSVFGTGILPSIITTDKRDGYVDVGYVGGGAVAGGGPFRQFRIENPFSAQVRVVWAPESAPAPVSQGNTDDGTAAVETIRRGAARMTEGFAQTYRELLGLREGFRAAVRERFATTTLRYIHNATVQYDQCLRVATGATPSADADLAQGLIKRIGIASRGSDPRVVTSECGQLWSTDIPYFVVPADSPQVAEVSGARRTVAELDRSPLEQFDEKLDALSDSDLQLQVRLIRLAFNAKLPDPHTMTDASKVLIEATPREDRAPLREIAAGLATDLIDGMVQDRFPHLPRTWIGPVASAVPERPWPPGVLGYDLYTGRVGPALTLATLGMGLREAAYVEAARAVLDPAAAVLAERQYELRSIAKAGTGAYNGFAGTVWAIAQAAGVLDEPTYREATRQGLELLPAGSPDNPRWFDLISGGMGVLQVRLALQGESADEAAVAACRYALDHGVLQQMEYSGLAHGVAGLLHFATRTYTATGAQVAGDLAQAAHAELNTTFRTAPGRFRTNRTGQENYSDSWCNGSAGLVLAHAAGVRAGLIETTALSVMVDAVRAASIATSLTLCHGMLGLYDSLDDLPGEAGEIGHDLRARIAGYLTPERIASSLASPDVRYNQSPCLMVGQAGVIWHLLDRLGTPRPASPLTLGSVV